MGPPYFYFENVAQTPKGVWEDISSSLYNVVPEFVDSKHFCAAMRKRGYVHNLPITNRFELLPRPPLTIQEVFSFTRDFWPAWDTQTQLNCLLTSVVAPKLLKEIRTTIESYNELNIEPPENVKKDILSHCKKWKFVVGWEEQGRPIRA